MKRTLNFLRFRLEECLLLSVELVRWFASVEADLFLPDVGLMTEGISACAVLMFVLFAVAVYL